VLSAQCPADTSDSAFANPSWADFEGNKFALGFAYTPGETIPWEAPETLLTIGIDRVAGPGTDGEFDQNGFLRYWSDYVANGVLSRKALLSLRAYVPPDDTPAPLPAVFQVPIHVYLNGQWVATAPAPTQSGDYIHCVEVDTQFVKFARRVPGGRPNCDPALGPTDACGINKLAFVMDLNSPPGVPDEDIGAGFVGVGTLSFKAMAPIVLVHGWNAGPWVWGPTPPNANVCPVNPDDSSDGGQNLVQALINAKVPFDCSIGIARQASIDQGAQVLADRLPLVANTFGARHANLVTHSKGGLFARSYLKLNSELSPSDQVGVISLTTLDTPHHGSVLSDTVVAARVDTSVLPLFIRPLYRFLMRVNLPGNSDDEFRNLFGPGNNDMTVQSLRTFNSRNPSPPSEFTVRFTGPGQSTSDSMTRPFYYSTAANADLNGDRVLQNNEAAPYFPLEARWRYERLSSVRSIDLIRLSSGRIIAVLIPTDGFKDNDTAVTVESGRYPGFSEIGSYLRNHTTILRPDVASGVLIRIRDAENTQTQP
jgi:hypothetical protein